MSDTKQRTKEQLSNDILKDVFQELHDKFINKINTSAVIGKLFSAKVISNDDMDELHFINNPHEKCRRLLIILHKAKNPRTFIELREAITTEESYGWLVETIDEKYNLLTSPAAQPQVTPVSSNPSLTPLNFDTGDVTELNRVIDDLRRDNAELRRENSRLLKENNKLKEDNERLCLERSTNNDKMANIESVQKSNNSVVTTKVTKLDGATGLSETSKKLTVDDLQKTSRDTDVILKRPLHDNPQLQYTVTCQRETDRDGRTAIITGHVVLDRYLYAVHGDCSAVEVYDCEDGRKIKDIHVDRMRPGDMVGCNVTSQLFINDVESYVIRRVYSKTGVSDVFVKVVCRSLSLVENRLLVTSRYSLLMFDIVSGKRIKKIPLPEKLMQRDYHQVYINHAIESNRESFFVSHGLLDESTVSEIDSAGRLLNSKQLDCVQMALDSVGRLFLTAYNNRQVVIFDEDLAYERILIDKEHWIIQAQGT